jgi:hypothetical protein
MIIILLIMLALTWGAGAFVMFLLFSGSDNSPLESIAAGALWPILILAVVAYEVYLKIKEVRQ